MKESIFEKNMRSFKSADREISALVLSCTNTDEVIKWTEGVTFGSEVIEEREVLYGIRDGQLYQLDSMYSSKELLDIWERCHEAGWNGKYLMFGMGNGMFARRILHGISESGLLLVYEPDLRLLRFVMEHFDISDILGDERLRLVVPQLERPDEESDLYSICAGCLEYTDMDSLQVVSYINYARLYPEAYEYFSERTTEVMSGIVANRHVLGRFGPAFVKNSLGNVPEFLRSRSIASLKGRAEGIPTIIVSSGPSLNKNISQLHRAKGRAVIAAADSAVSVLLKAGIKPDIFFCVDAKKNKGHFTDPMIHDIPLGCDMETTMAAFADHDGLCFFGRGRNPHLNAFLDREGIEMPRLKTGGSVAHAAMSFMRELGCDTFILAGQDLAYTGDKSHADGSLRASWDMDLSKNECYVEGIDGEQIRSSHEFVTYRNWFERELEKDPALHLINATEGGARIHGAREMSLSDAIDELCTGSVDAAAIFESADMLMSDAQCDAFKAYMGELRGEVEELADRIRKGISIYDEMYRMAWEGKYSGARFKKLYDRTQEISAYLDGAGAMYYVECMVQKQMTELMDRPVEESRDERAQLIDVIESGREYFSIVKQGIEKLRPLVESF